MKKDADSGNEKKNHVLNRLLLVVHSNNIFYRLGRGDSLDHYAAAAAERGRPSRLFSKFSTGCQIYRLAPCLLHTSGGYTLWDVDYINSGVSCRVVVVDDDDSRIQRMYYPCNKTAIDLSNASPACGRKEGRISTDHIIVTAPATQTNRDPNRDKKLIGVKTMTLSTNYR